MPHFFYNYQQLKVDMNFILFKKEIITIVSPNCY